ncbi:MAG: hypothetical protein IKE64_08950 [Thermoguttaceae bacterium]|nr:hypothetical protein [Thermoguttaceae bacterium]
MQRRDFLKTSMALAAVAAARGVTAQEKTSPRWYKGNIHCHSQWSDGEDLPEVMVSEYKNRGYQFFCLSDHNIIQTDRLRFNGFAMDFTPKDLTPFEGKTSFWKRVAAARGWSNLTEEDIKQAQDRFGADSVDILDTDEGRYVRMKTFDELNAQFGEPGKFLMMPGFEMTARFVHTNCVNVKKDYFVEIADDGQTDALLKKSADTAKQLYADNGQPWFFTVNHPQWQYYNIQPSSLISRPDLIQLELLNNGTGGPLCPDAWTPESFFDVVNAWRASHDQHLLMGTGTDDSHGCFRTDEPPFKAWQHVRCSELTPGAIFDAMNRGDSYCSNGIELEDLAFDGKTLQLRAVEGEGKYRIDFIGTKKDYDPTPKPYDVAAAEGLRARQIESYSPEIGKVLESVEGREGSYTLKADDLYVRARVYRLDENKDPVVRPESGLYNFAAWTQSYAPGRPLETF